MRKLLQQLLAFCMVLSIPSIVLAQKTITGKITDAKNAPLSGAAIIVKSSKSGVYADAEGVFSVKAKPTDVLEISMLGYATQLVTVNGKLVVNVKLEAVATNLSEVVLVGSRRGSRVKTESPVPIDVININQAGAPTAKMDLTSVLNYAAPSFNYNKQSGADGADHVDLGTLRGLGPDQTLVLINGKRRHQTAFVALFGTRGRGNSGTDLNAFPQAAVDKIEILRDGASAQYGSDAMAGVINIILKKDVNQWTVNAGWSGYYDHQFNARKFNAGNQYESGGAIDGNTFSLSLNNGWALGKKGGFINFSVDALTQGKTFRQVDTLNWQTEKYNLPSINRGRRAFGDGSVNTIGVMYNMEVPVTAKTTIYSFGGYNYKASDAYAYSRNWKDRPERFPIASSGQLIFDPSIMKISKGIVDTFYDPHIQTNITDASLAAGIKGMIGNDWNWDLSNTMGINDFHFYGDKTYNASIIGTKSPNHFDDGGFNFLQNTLNLDLNKQYKTIAQGLNIAFGAEYRYERYEIYKGEDASFKNYAPTSIQKRGSQGFPGFSPDDERKANRSTVGVYADAELNVTKALLMDGAIRLENYNDFGFVNTVKLASRLKITDNFNLRGSVSTGYRAPSLQQINFSNTLTSYYNGKLVESRIANNTATITRNAGIPNLKQETSINTSLGFSWKPIKNLTITTDGYLVKVKDRIVLSGLFSTDDPSLPAVLTSELNNLNVKTGQFFDNAVNTTNYGLDIVVDYTKKWRNQAFKLLLAGNIQTVTIDKVHVPTLLNDSKLHQKTFFSDREESFLKASAPKSKFSLNLDYSINKIGIGTHLTYFGDLQLLGFGNNTTDNPYGTGINPTVPTDADGSISVPEVFNYNAKLTTDIYASYKLCKSASLFVGADNLFNVHPDLGVNPAAKGWFGDNESGGPWDSVQMGFNGLRLFSKLVLNF